MEGEIEIAPLFCVYGGYTIPQRRVLMVMLHLAGVSAHMTRNTLDTIIFELGRPNNTDLHNTCPEYEYQEVENVAFFIWPEWVKNWIMYSFYLGYIVGHIPGGWLSDKIGGRNVLGISMLTCAIVSFLLPMSIEYGGPKAAISLHLLLGLAQGVIFPAIASFIQHWAPHEEREYIGGISYSGNSLGAFVVNLCTGTIMKSFENWALPFYIWGSLSLIWYLFSLLTVFSRPSTHPFINDEELRKLTSELGERRKKHEVPWSSLFTSTPVWALLLVNFADCYTWYTMVLNLPEYMSEILKWEVDSNPAVNALPFLGTWLTTLLMARLADHMLNKDWFSLIALRKIYAFIGNVIPAICILAAVELGCSRIGAISCYIVALCLKAPFYTVALNCNDLSRNHPGVVMGIVNGLSSVAGILGPWTVAYLTPNGSLAQWRSVYWIIFGISLFNTVIFLLFGKVERQPWDLFASEHRSSITSYKRPSLNPVDGAALNAAI